MKRRMLAIVALAALFVLIGHEDAIGREEACGMVISCGWSGGLGCNDAPTSLKPVLPNPFQPIFEVPTSGNCGWESCWVIFSCACGDGLTGAPCGLLPE